MKANILPMFACRASLQPLPCVKRVRRKQDDSYRSKEGSAVSHGALMLGG